MSFCTGSVKFRLQTGRKCQNDVGRLNLDFLTVDEKNADPKDNFSKPTDKLGSLEKHPQTNLEPPALRIPLDTTSQECCLMLRMLILYLPTSPTFRNTDQT